MKLNTTRDDERGMVSILVSMVMIIVITMVVLGFSQLSRNEVTQSLNKQLSVEAFYAANSAVNNAAALLQSGGAVVAQTASCTNDNGGGTTYTNNKTLSSSHSVAYSCVTVSPQVKTIIEDIGQQNAKAFPLEAAPGNTLASVNFSWTPPPNANGNPVSITNCNSTVGTLYPESGWTCTAGALQVDLISGSDSQSLAGQQEGTYNFVLYPKTNNPGDSTFALSSVGPSPSSGVEPVHCTSTVCSLTLDLPTPNQNTYYVRVTSLYREDSLTVTGQSVINGPNVLLYNAQADVDATGIAQNVLQRLDARVPLNNFGGVQYALQTEDSLCKRVEGYPGYEDVGLSDVNGSTYTDGTQTQLNSATNLSACSYNRLGSDLDP